MTEQWQELKETITELRDNDGTGTQQEVCKFLVNYMDVLEKQMQEPCEDAKAIPTAQDDDYVMIKRTTWEKIEKALDSVSARGC